MGCMKCGSKKRLCPGSFGLAFGIICGIFMMLLGWFAIQGYGVGLVTLYSTIYYGYAPTWIGGLIGGLWGLVEGFIFGFLVALVYNCFSRCCRGICCRKGEACTCETTETTKKTY